jgi:hypothetical protein
LNPSRFPCLNDTPLTRSAAVRSHYQCNAAHRVAHRRILNGAVRLTIIGGFLPVLDLFIFQ